jgi:uncharacterized protein
MGWHKFRLFVFVEGQHMENGASTLKAPSDLAIQSRGFGPVGLLSMALVVAASFLPALRDIVPLLWVWWSETPWSDIGYSRPKSWLRTIAGGIIFGVILKLFTKAVIMPLIGADPINRTYQLLVGNKAAVAGMALAVTVNGGFGEETFFRGYAFERVSKLLGSSPAVKVLLVLVTSALFALAHYPDQGLTGVEQAAITGLAFGTTFAITGRIFVVMIAHAVYDLTAIAIIYYGQEERLAHLLFR